MTVIKNFDEWNEIKKKTNNEIDSKTEGSKQLSSKRNRNGFNKQHTKTSFGIHQSSSRSSLRQHKSVIAPSGSTLEILNRQSVLSVVHSKNVLDIWVKSSPFFSQIPEESQLEQLFMTTIPEIQPNFALRSQWISIFSSFSNSLKEKNIEVVDLPFQKADQDSSFSKYWVKNSVPYPIESEEKKEFSPIHSIINALVDEGEEEDGNETKHTEYPLPYALPSVISSHSYLGLPFEDRLQNELESAGIINDVDDAAYVSSYESEAKACQKELQRLQPVLDSFRKEVHDMYPEIAKDQERREEIQKQFMKQINVLKKTKRKE